MKTNKAVQIWLTPINLSQEDRKNLTGFIEIRPPGTILIINTYIYIFAYNIAPINNVFCHKIVMMELVGFVKRRSS